MDTQGTASLPQRGGPYSLARTLPNGLVFIAGQTAVDPATGHLVEGGIAEQTHQAIANVVAVLTSEGYDLGDVVKVSVFLTDFSDFTAMNEVYRSYFHEPYPVRTTVQAGLGAGTMVEVDAIAVRAR